MTVIDLAMRRAARQPSAPRDYCCPRHVLDELAARTAQRIDAAESLLIPRSDLEAVLADLRATTDRLLPLPHGTTDTHAGGQDA